MIINVFLSIWDDLLKFFSNSTSAPTKEWTILQTLQLLQQYPSGLSKIIILCELECKW